MKIRKTVRIILANCLYVTGLLSLILWLRLRKRAVVLMYHRILIGEEISRRKTQSGITVEVNTFQRQIGYIHKYFNPISLQEFINHLERNIPFPNRACLITFDDGWRDNFLNAYPILKENRLSAVIFLPTDFIGTRRSFWQEELADLLVEVQSRFSEDKDLLQKQRILGIEGMSTIIESDPEDLPQEITLFLNLQKKKSLTEIEKLIQSLRLILGDEPSYEKREPVFLNWDEVKTMADDGIAFGSHGKSHSLLPALGAQEADEEIKESKEFLEKNLGQNIDAFSYPNGNYNKSVAKSVQNRGYRVAFGTEKGFVSHGVNPLNIPRINIHQDMTDSIPMLMARIAGLW